jgi:MFS family permease
MIWGSISACTAAVQSYEALLGVRVLLGVSEAVFFPGAIYLLSSWYAKNELGVRIAGQRDLLKNQKKRFLADTDMFSGLYFFQQFGNAFGGLIAAGLLRLDGVHGIAGWRWLFIV